MPDNTDRPTLEELRNSAKRAGDAYGRARAGGFMTAPLMHDQLDKDIDALYSRALELERQVEAAAMQGFFRGAEHLSGTAASMENAYRQRIAALEAEITRLRTAMADERASKKEGP